MIEQVRASFNKKPADIPVIAVTGGKGGTGKTTVAVNLATALSDKGHRVLFVDADADSPTAAIVLGVQLNLFEEVETFVPRIISARCDRCGKCAEACRPHALIQIAGKEPMFFEELCSGCEACLLACPSQAIEKGKKAIGYLRHAIRPTMTLIEGGLKPSESRSAQVVTAAKDAAFERARMGFHDIMIVDTSPGTHCNVVQGLRGADLALAVTEPTPLGTYDLTLMMRLLTMLGIPCKVVLNKANLAGGEREPVLQVARRYGSEVIAEIPVDMNLFKSYVAGEPLVRTRPDSQAAQSIMKLADAFIHLLPAK